MAKHRLHYRLFGGDASRQNAEWYRDHIDGSLYRLIDDISPKRFGLDAFATDGHGTVYDFVVVKWNEGAREDRRTADRIDGYDRDDLGESPDF